MFTPPRIPDNSLAEVAEILTIMSKSSSQEPETDHESPKTPIGNASLSSAASTPFSSSIAVAKVSNSDDEDMDMEAPNVRHETMVNRAAASQLLNDKLHARSCVPEVPAALKVSSRSPWADSAGDTFDARRPQNVPTDSSSFTISNDQDPRTASFARAPPSTQTVPPTARNITPLNGLSDRRSSLPSLISPDMVDTFLGPTSSFAGSNFARYLGPRLAARQPASQPPLENVMMPHHRAPSGSQCLLRPRLSAESTSNVPDVERTDATLADRPLAQSAPIPPTYMPTAALPRVVSDGAPGPAPPDETTLKGQIPVYHASRKRVVAPPKNSAAKRARDGFECKDVDITDFKYRTMKAIQMPARNDLLPDQRPPQPTPAVLPYGDEIDYHSSMLLWWLDELELTYTETARRYRAMFAGTSDTDDTIRKKHHVALIRLARKYGLKPEDQIEEPSKAVARRGQQAGHKYNSIGGKAIYAAGAGADDAGKIRRHRVSEPKADRGFLKACICVWKDTSDVSFALIQQRLAHEYDWHLGVNTVQKMYYDERKRVYDRYDQDGKERTEQSVPELVQKSERHSEP